MLVDEVEQLIIYSQRVVDIRTHIRSLNNFKKRQKLFEQAVKDIKPLVIAIKAFMKRGLANFDKNDKAERFLLDINKIQVEFKNNRGWIIESEDFDVKRFQSSVNGLKDTLEKQLRQAWITYRNRNLPPNSSEMDLLERVPTLKLTVQEFRQRSTQVLAVSFPKDDEHFEQLEQAITEAAEAWNSLKEVPEDVQCFLKAATTQGSPIELLTPEVRDWLTDKGVISSFRIRLSDLA